MKKKKTLVFGLVVFVALGAVAAITWSNRASHTPMGLVQTVERERQPVRTVRVAAADRAEVLRASGILRAARDVTLTSEVTGTIRTVTKDMGDACAKGEVLLRIDTENYHLALSQAEAAVRQSKVGRDHAQREMARQQRLRDSQAVAGARFDQARQIYEAAVAGLEQAEAVRSQAARSLRKTTLRCPFDGFVAERLVDEGKLVSPATPLLRLVDLSQLELMLHVTAADRTRLQIGQTARVVDPARPDLGHPAQVSRLGVAADPQTRTFPVEIAVTQSQDATQGTSLLAGQVVRAELELASHPGVLAVPIDALPAGGPPDVWVVEADKAVRRPVSLGPTIDGWTIVHEGLGAGDEVVVVGRENLIDDVSVQVVGAPEKPSPAPVEGGGPEG